MCSRLCSRRCRIIVIHLGDCLSTWLGCHLSVVLCRDVWLVGPSRHVCWASPLTSDVKIWLERSTDCDSGRFVGISNGSSRDPPTHRLGGAKDIVAIHVDLAPSRLDVIDIGLSDHSLLRGTILVTYGYDRFPCCCLTVVTTLSLQVLHGSHQMWMNSGVGWFGSLVWRRVSRDEVILSVRPVALSRPMSPPLLPLMHGRFGAGNTGTCT